MPHSITFSNNPLSETNFDDDILFVKHMLGHANDAELMFIGLKSNERDALMEKRISTHRIDTDFKTQQTWVTFLPDVSLRQNATVIAYNELLENPFTTQDSKAIAACGLYMAAKFWGNPQKHTPITQPLLQYAMGSVAIAGVLSTVSPLADVAAFGLAAAGMFTLNAVSQRRKEKQLRQFSECFDHRTYRVHKNEYHSHAITSINGNVFFPNGVASMAEKYDRYKREKSDTTYNP